MRKQTPGKIELLEAPDKDYTRRVCHCMDPIAAYFRYTPINLENIPAKGGVMVVMNHAVIPFHSYLLAKTLVEKRNIFPRGLVARFMLEIPGARQLFLKTGVHNASPENAHKLLREGNIVLITPGGIQEALLCKPGTKEMPWENRTGYVKTAIKAGVPIVPSYCHGADLLYFNSHFLLGLRLKLLKLTRFSLPFFFGIGLLPLPIRLVHMIGEPISTRRIKGETTDQQIRRIHASVLDTINALASK